MEKERVRRRQEARTGETDTIAVNIKKETCIYCGGGRAEGSKDTSRCGRYKKQTAEEEGEQEGTEKVAGTVISTVEKRLEIRQGSSHV